MTRHNKSASHLVAQFSEKTGKSLRAAQWNRQHRTRAWRQFCGIGEESPPTQPPQPPQAQPRPKAPQVHREAGLKGELERIEAELVTLSERLAQAGEERDLASELSLHRTIDTKREIMRKLRLANPEITREDGSMIPAQSVFAYVTKVRAHLSALPQRIASALSAEVALEGQRRIAAEINAVLDEAAKIDLDL